MLAHRAQLEAVRGVIDIPPAQQNQQKAEINRQIVLKKYIADKRDLFQQRNGQRFDLRPLDAGVRVADKIGQVTAHQG
jgi:hypothetical protein